MSAQPSPADISRAVTTLRLLNSSSCPPTPALLRECRALCAAAGDVSVSPEMLSRVLRHADETRALLAPLLRNAAPAPNNSPRASDEPATLLSLPTELLTQIVARSSARTLVALDRCCSAFHAPRAPAGRSVVEEALPAAIEATVVRHLAECSPTRIAVAVAQVAELQLPGAMRVGPSGGGGSGGFNGGGSPSARRRIISLYCLELAFVLARSWGALRDVDGDDEPHLLGAQPHRLAAAAEAAAVPTLRHARDATGSVEESVQYLLTTHDDVRDQCDHDQNSVRRSPHSGVTPLLIVVCPLHGQDGVLCDGAPLIVV